MKKNVLLTVLDSNEGLSKLLSPELARSGLEPLAHLWRDDLPNMPGLGLWFEPGPAEHAWDGAFFACWGEGSVPNAHGVGLAGTIPSTCTLHYPVRDMRLNLGAHQCTGYGVKNALSPAESYYARVSGVPEGINFGPFPDANEAELFTLTLC